jgi:hypothetical protein
MTYAKVDEKGEMLIESIPNKGDREIFQIAQYFLKSHFNSRDGLKEIGVVRTNKLAHAEYAEWLVAKLLNGTLPKSSVNKGFDVEVLENKKKIKYEVKCRLIDKLNKNPAFHVKIKKDNNRKPFDHVACVFLTPTFEVLGVFTITYDALIEVGEKDKRDEFRRSLRWNKTNINKYKKHIEWVWQDKKFAEN